MQKLFFLAALALLSIPAFSQRDPGIVQDSVSTFTRNDTIFQRVYVKFANGKETLVVEPIGDTATVLNSAFNGIVEQSRQFHSHVVVAMQRDVIIKNFRDLNAIHDQYGPTDAFKAITKAFFRSLVDTVGTVVNYNYITGGVTTPVRIDLTSGGNIRIRNLPNNGTGGITCRMYSEKVLRLMNYPANSDTYLYFWQPNPKKPGIWKSEDNLITLRRIGGNNNR